MFGGIIRHLFFPPCLLRNIRPRAIPLSVILVPFNTHFMTYCPNVNGPCHCPQCLNSLRVLGPTIGGSHGPGRYYLCVCAYIQLLSSL